MKRVLLGIFALFFSVASLLSSSASAQSNTRAAERFASFSVKLGLSRTQKEEVRPILIRSFMEVRDVLKSNGFERGKPPTRWQLLRVRPKIMAIRGSTRAALSDILSPSQMVKYDTLQQQRQRQWREEVRSRMQASN